MAINEWSDEEIRHAIENRFEKSYAEIGKDLGRTRNAVMIKLNRLGYKLPEKYNFNRRFFQKIDTEHKAYWLGFLYADGYVSGLYETGIELKRSDRGHLVKFNKSLNGNLKIKDFEKFLNVTGKNYKMSSIRIYSKLFVYDLKKVGLVERKSAKIGFPKIPNHLMNHFVRGYFDGDGSLHVYKEKKQLRAKFTCASIDFLNSVCEILDTVGVEKYHIIDKTKKNKSYNLQISGKKSTKIFLEWIYRDATICLDRKYKFYCNKKHLLEYKYNAWNYK